MTYQPHPWQQGEQPAPPPSGVPPMGNPSPPNVSPRQASKPPGSLTGAFAVAIVAPVLAVVLLGFSYFALTGWLGSLADGSAREIGDVPLRKNRQEEVEILSPYVDGVFIVLALLFLGMAVLWVALGFRLRQGGQGARSFLTVLAVLWLIVGVPLSVCCVVLGGVMVRPRIAQGYGLDLPWTVFIPWGAHAGLAVVSMIAFLALAHRQTSTEYIKAMNPSSS